MFRDLQSVSGPSTRNVIKSTDQNTVRGNGWVEARARTTINPRCFLVHSPFFSLHLRAGSPPAEALPYSVRHVLDNPPTKTKSDAQERDGGWTRR